MEVEHDDRCATPVLRRQWHRSWRDACAGSKGKQTSSCVHHGRCHLVCTEALQKAKCSTGSSFGRFGPSVVQEDGNWSVPIALNRGRLLTGYEFPPFCCGCCLPFTSPTRHRLSSKP